MISGARLFGNFPEIRNPVAPRHRRREIYNAGCRMYRVTAENRIIPEGVVGSRRRSPRAIVRGWTRRTARRLVYRLLAPGRPVSPLAARRHAPDSSRGTKDASGISSRLLAHCQRSLAGIRARDVTSSSALFRQLSGRDVAPFVKPTFEARAAREDTGARESLAGPRSIQKLRLRVDLPPR